MLTAFQAIVQMREGDKIDGDGLGSIYGALFFGVPNLGIRNEQWLPMVQGQANEAFIRTLDPGSEYLLQLHQKFLSAFAFSDSCILSIYETEETQVAKVIIT